MVELQTMTETDASSGFKVCVRHTVAVVTSSASCCFGGGGGELLSDKLNIDVKVPLISLSLL